MITLDYLVINNSYEYTKNYALVFNDNIKELIINANEEYGTSYFMLSPRKLTDSRWMICADILSEIQENGLFYNVWRFIDHDKLDNNINVMSMEEVNLLLEQPEKEDID